MSKARNKIWPRGILCRVSREAYDAIGRARGFGFATPAEREALAVSYDKAAKLSPAIKKEKFMSKTKPKALQKIEAKAKAGKKPSALESTYRNLWRFFDGAMSDNSGGHCDDDCFDGMTPMELVQAEVELDQVTSMYGIDPRVLGAMADAGYNLFGQTHQNVDDNPDDDQHRLKAFELLDKLY